MGLVFQKRRSCQHTKVGQSDKELAYNSQGRKSILAANVRALLVGNL